MTLRISFLGLDFDALPLKDAAAAIAARAGSGAAFSYVATPNVDHIVRIDGEPRLRELYAGAWLTLCDSRILELLARASGRALPVAPGADLVEALFRDHVWPRDPVTVIGGSAAAVEALRKRYHLANLFWFDAPSGLRDDAEARTRCVDFIRDHPADFVLLAVGSPQQEMIAHETLARGGAVGVAICCGASLDFLTGETARAPRWMQTARLEWLHRLATEPKRLWRRYLMDGPAIVRLWLEWRWSAFRRAGNRFAIRKRDQTRI
ncbi:MAG: WecB/TagA/CpsF family glycosyltransferase [Alphaproteobacteria bacterium]|nr:WecB/TagA/CpsF family glycosyltransferase [Alphaproteobacteria bacterium]